jgi:hypothetical protein
MLPFFHEDIEYLPREEGGAIRGHPGLRRYFERWMEPWEEFRIDLSEPRPCGDSVFNACDMTARGRTSGVGTTMKSWQVWRFVDGKAARWEEYLDRTDALQAVGLAE